MTIDLPERFNLASASTIDDRLVTLREVFPEVFRQDGIDFDALRRSLGNWVDPGPERFGLTWPGKGESTRLIQEPSIGTLLPMHDESVNWDTTHNVIIEGDNLEVLKLLQKAYYGKIKMIYIDPPYNTGKEFIYPDNFREGLRDYLRYSGQIDNSGLRNKARLETSGRHHSKWLSMMYPRLFLARNLLRGDGIMFVSIDDNEADNLKKICDEIFGEENFLGFACRVAKKTNNKGDYWAPNFDYVATYARDRAVTPPFFGGANLAAYNQVDAEGPRKGEQYQLVRLYMSNIHNQNPEQRYFIDCPDGTAVIPPGSTFPPERPTIRDGIWRWTRRKFEEEFDKIVVKEVRSSNLSDREGRPAKWNVYTKTYLNDVVANASAKPNNLLETFLNEQGSEELNALGIPFDYPKPSALIRHLMSISGCKGDDLVLDFFAGSGSTAQAVLDLNTEDGNHRRFILVQLPEPAETEGYATIADICRERVRRVISSKAEQEQLQIGGDADGERGFRSYRLAASNFEIWDSSITAPEKVAHQLEMTVDHVLATATEQSMIAELLLKAGYPLTAEIDEVDFAGVKGYSVAGGALLVSLSPTLSIEAFEAMVALEPAMILVLDAGFGGSDELKVNALQTVRARNQQAGSDIALRVV
ncbi:MAG: site-specific DNA-methyltransferase [Acidimicrobiales bacterium]